MRHQQGTAQTVTLVVISILVLASPAFAGDCPELVGALGFQYAADVAVSGNYAFVAWTDFSGEGGLRVFDVSDPYHPVEVGFVDFDWGAPRAVAVSGSYAYVADPAIGWGILRVIDVSEPTAPVQVGSVEVGDAQDVAVSGDYAYVVNWGFFGSGSFTVIDVSEPTAPVPVGYLGGSRRGVAVSGGYAYDVGDYYFEVIDVSDPWAPVQVGGLYSSAGGYGVAVSGGYAYVAFPDASGLLSRGLDVIDVSEPTAPVEVGFLDTPTSAWDVAVSRGYAYVVVGDEFTGGLYVIDVSTPSAPVEAGYHEAGQADDIVGGIAVSGGHVFLANWGGLFVFRECGWLFFDGFESGDTSAWSATVP